MNRELLILALAPLTTVAVQAQSKTSPERFDKRPNIILFMVDDMGWQDTSLPFWTEKTKYNQAYETPNMERLAHQGMMFPQSMQSHHRYERCPSPGDELDVAEKCPHRQQERCVGTPGLELQRRVSSAGY